ncbi:hypothetical protein [Lactobacillus huangpiensis]|uniref:hypothetical protein n=1 Tax=Lactobacillus huangpiensis TaxID=2799571 RepID=UPI001CC6CA8C|nr:hypothetical protein [Lactobacillus huangpiensis]
MLSRTKKFILIILIIYLLLTTWQIVLAFKDGAGLIPLNGKAVDISVMLFFSIQPNGWNENIINLVMMLAFVPTFGAGLLIYCKNNNMFGAVQQRIGYHDFIKGGIINSFIVGFLFSLMTNLYQLALIRVFYYPFFFKIRPRKLYIGVRPGYFSTNQLIDLCSYVILAAVGWGIFAVFIFSIGLFVTKNSIYLILGPCVGLGLTLLSVLMSMGNKFLLFVSYSWFPFAVLAPGQFALASRLPPINSYLLFMTVALIYLLFAACLIQLWRKKKRRLG